MVNIVWRYEFGVGNKPTGLTIYRGHIKRLSDLPENLEVCGDIVIDEYDVPETPTGLRVTGLVDIISVTIARV